ncbi:MAG: glycosyltransferase family 2 protein [Nitrospinaceae bacterium]
MAHISVVIPVYKAEGCLDTLHRRLKDALGAISEDFEIILVEDCGGDRSWEIIQDLAAQDKRVKGIQFSRNFGQHHGITAGLERCTGDWVVVMDCDLQDRPEEIPRLYAKAQEGYDVVLARRGRRRDGKFKILSSQLFYKIFNYLSNLNYDPETSNFSIISRKVVHSLLLFREQLRFYAGLLSWVGFRKTSLAVEHGGRLEGRTTYTFLKLRRLATDVIIAYSDKPLRLSIKFGFAMAFFAFLFGSYIILLVYLYGVVVPGWYSLMVSLYFLGGIIIANLGIIGIYLGKTFEEAKKRPLYVIENTVGYE